MTAPHGSSKTTWRFPKKFLWGASISTHQVEGGNHNQWSVWELETARVKAAQAPYEYGHLKNWPAIKAQATNPENYVSGRAADHFSRYEHDFALAQQLHLNSLRSGIEWSRLEPEEGRFDPQAIEHYTTYFRKLTEAGITPVISLWHWTMPVWFADKGGFAKRRNLKYWRRYVQQVCRLLGAEQLKYVITINEPTIYALFSYKQHRWPPQQDSFWLMQHVLLNLARAHKQAYKIIKSQYPKTQIGLAHNCAYFYAGDNSPISKLSAWLAHKIGNEYFITLVRRHQDFLGVNYYFANEYHGTQIHNPARRVSDVGWDMQPDKIRPLLSQLHAKYKRPIMITESGLADSQDQQRGWWITESIKAMDGALKDGVPMLGYIHWSLLDNFEWAEGFWPRFGLIEVNYKTFQRKVRPSAQGYARLIKISHR